MLLLLAADRQWCHQRRQQQQQVWVQCLSQCCGCRLTVQRLGARKAAILLQLLLAALRQWHQQQVWVLLLLRLRQCLGLCGSRRRTVPWGEALRAALLQQHHLLLPLLLAVVLALAVL
jgi:hypothetical protein